MENDALIHSLTAKVRVLEDTVVQLRRQVREHEGRLEAEEILRRAGAPHPVPLPGRGRPRHLYAVRGAAAVTLASSLLRWGARVRAHKVAMAALGTVVVGTAAVTPSIIAQPGPAPLAAGEGAAPLLARPHHHHAHAGAGPPLSMRTVRHRRRERDHATAAPGAEPSPSPSPSPLPDPSPSPAVTITGTPGPPDGWAGPAGLQGWAYQGMLRLGSMP